MMLSPLSIASEQSSNAWLEAELATSQVYVQAQALYRLRFYQAIALQDIAVTPPAVRLAEVLPLGELTQSEVERAGTRYRVSEQLYRIHPLVSGDLSIAGAQISAKAPGDGQKRLDWLAQPITLKVLAVPESEEQNQWLPAKNVKLSEQWSVLDDQVADGSVITRQIKVEAMGVSARQIPELTLSIPGVIVQPQPAVRINHLENNQNVAELTQQFFIYVNSGRQLVVPSMSLTWWNSQTNSSELERLPERLFKVYSEPEALQRVNDIGSANLVAPHSTIKPEQPEQSAVATSIGYSVTVALILLLIAWQVKQPRSFYHWWPVLWACYQGNRRQLADALLCWMKKQQPNSAPQTLGALIAMLDDHEALQLLRELDRQLYGPQSLSQNKRFTVKVMFKVRRGLLLSLATECSAR